MAMSAIMHSITVNNLWDFFFRSIGFTLFFFTDSRSFTVFIPSALYVCWQYRRELGKYESFTSLLPTFRYLYDYKVTSAKEIVNDIHTCTVVCRGQLKQKGTSNFHKKYRGYR